MPDRSRNALLCVHHGCLASKREQVLYPRQRLSRATHRQQPDSSWQFLLCDSFPCNISTTTFRPVAAAYILGCGKPCPDTLRRLFPLPKAAALRSSSQRMSCAQWRELSSPQIRQLTTCSLVLESSLFISLLCESGFSMSRTK